MIKKLLILILLVCPVLTFSQTLYKTINSTKLGKERELKIQLPRNYDKNTEKTYPILIVLDGDYLFEPIAGTVDYYSYWDDIPEMIVVGINMDSSRTDDAYYNANNSLPEKSGADFFEFIGMELMPYLDNNYRTSTFRIIAGQDLTSNFINYYLFKEKPLFSGYINLSPDLAPMMEKRIVSALQNSEKKIWYYLATSSEDIEQLKKPILDLDSQLQALHNKNVYYNFDNFQGETHYTLVAKAIPNAIEEMFEVYRPISVTDYNKILLQTSVSAYDYLIQKYDDINDLFGIEKKVSINDFMAVYQAMEKRQQWDQLKDLAKLAEKNYPTTMLATFFEARYEEETGNPKKAMRDYQKAYGQQPIAFLTVDFMMDKAQKIKDDFGY
ncbi:MAG: alpha/beta hydrolase-fold protein [Gillisia sp.]